jgi:hypothetical protein
MATLKLAAPLLNQLIAVTQRYQGAAIAAINPALDPIQEFHKGPKLRTAFPWMTFAYGGTAFEETSEQTRFQRMLATVTLESSNFDEEFAQDQAIDYMRVLDLIYMSMAGPPPFYQDWESPLPIQQETVPSGITVPFTQGSVKEVFIEHAEQSLVLESESEVPVIQVSLQMRFDVEEFL